MQFFQKTIDYSHKPPFSPKIGRIGICIVVYYYNILHNIVTLEGIEERTDGYYRSH